MRISSETRLLNFLQNDLAIPATDLQFALRQGEESAGPLPMILWQYGLVDITQLDRIFDWMDGHSA